MGRLARSLSAPINLSDLARDVGLADHRLADARVSALVSAFLAYRCYQDNKGSPNLAAQRKVYFTDPLLARLPSILDPTYREPDPSVVCEQQVGLALHRAIERERPGAFVQLTEVRCWVNRVTRAEIDFVGARLGAGFEVKYVDGGWRGASRPLGARGTGGVVATRSVLDLADDLLAVPAGLLAWVLGD